MGDVNAYAASHRSLRNKIGIKAAPCYVKARKLMAVTFRINFYLGQIGGSVNTAMQATPEDVAAIFDVRCSVKENHLSRAELAELDITPETVSGMITGGDYIVPVALVGGEIVAFAMAQISEGYVFALFVRPEYEGNGLGSALMREVESGFKEHGVTEAWLCTGSEEGIRAPGFYRRLGWIESGIMEDGQLRFYTRL